MKVEDTANLQADVDNLLKFREILCIFLKDYARANGIILSQKEIGDGMETYLCQ